MANNNATHVVTGKARLSYTNVFTPYSHQQGQEPKYSVTVLVPKADTQTKAKIDTAIATATEAGKAKWNGVVPPVLSICVHDGDGVRPSDGMSFGEECKGHWVFAASSKQAPKVVDANVQPIIDASEIYSGCYGRVSVDFFPYSSNGKKGIGCGLQNVQKLADGDPLGNRFSAEDDFGAPSTEPSNPFAVPGAAPF